MSTASPGTELLARLADAERQLKQLSRQADRSNLLALIIGLLALGVLSFYFWYGHQQLEKATRPDEVVALAQGLVEANLPAAREQVQSEIVRTAPELAKSLSKQALNSLPGARLWLAETLVGQVRESFQQTALISDKEIRSFIQNNRPMMERNLQRLAASDSLAENELQEIVQALEGQEGIDFKSRADLYYDAAGELREKLARLAMAKDLSAGEEIERRVFMLARRLQMETLKDATEPRPPVLAGSSDRTPEDESNKAADTTAESAADASNEVTPDEGSIPQPGAGSPLPGVDTIPTPETEAEPVTNETQKNPS